MQANSKWEPKKLTQTVKVNMDQRLVCDAVLTGITADGKPVKEQYSFYWPGINGEKFNLLAGTTATTYYRKPPRKVKVYAKPKNLVYYRKPSPRMLELRGLFHEHFHIPEAATRGGIAEIRGSDFNFVSFAGSSLSYVPSSFEEMFDYDLVVMNDVDADVPDGFRSGDAERIRECRRKSAGAGRAVRIWPGGYRDTQMADMLPVETKANPFDLKKADPPTLIKVADTAKILKGTRLKQKGYCFWMHTVKPKAGALCGDDSRRRTVSGMRQIRERKSGCSGRYCNGSFHKRYERVLGN